MRGRWFGLAVTTLAAGLSVGAYPRLPATIATQWNGGGEPARFVARWLVTGLLPLLMLGFTLLAGRVRRTSPLSPSPRGDQQGLPAAYWWLANALLILFLALHAMLLAIGLGAPVPSRRLAPLGVGLLLVLAAALVSYPLWKQGGWVGGGGGQPPRD
jgi:uncharacterized membrane protein